MAKKQKWDVDNQSVLSFDEGEAPCFKLWPTEGDNTALLDADMFPYIVGFSQSEDAWYKVLLRAEANKLSPLTEGFHEWLFRQPECQQAINHCDALVNGWADMIEADSAKLYLTAGDKQFRYDVAFSKLYKGGPSRAKPKPPFFSLIKWHLEKHHNAIVACDCEADDLMSIEQYQANKRLSKASGYKQGHRNLKNFSYTTIVTKDKDLAMIPGWHSNPDINKGEPYWVDELGELLPVYNDDGKMKKLGGTGLKFFYAQMLMGDTVDHYGGLPNCGMVAAFRLLDEVETVKQCHQIVEDKYKAKYHSILGKKFPFTTWTGKTIHVTWQDMFLEQGRLAWMQRKPNDVWMKKLKMVKPKKWRVKNAERDYIAKLMAKSNG